MPYENYFTIINIIDKLKCPNIVQIYINILNDLGALDLPFLT